MIHTKYSLALMKSFAMTPYIVIKQERCRMYAAMQSHLPFLYLLKRQVVKIHPFLELKWRQWCAVCSSPSFFSSASLFPWQEQAFSLCASCLLSRWQLALQLCCSAVGITPRVDPNTLESIHCTAGVVRKAEEDNVAHTEDTHAEAPPDEF